MNENYTRRKIISKSGLVIAGLGMSLSFSGCSKEKINKNKPNFQISLAEWFISQWGS